MIVQKSASRVRKLGMVAVPLILLSLGACATPFNAHVTRFSAFELPAPQGQTFAVVPENPKLVGGLEFAQYARLVEAQMVRLGYGVAPPETADMIVRFDFGIDGGRQRIRSTGFGYDPFWGPWHSPWGVGRGGWGAWGGGGWGGGGWGGGGWGGWGRPFRGGGRWGFGWYDPWFNNGLETYTVFTSGIDLRIDRRVDNKRLFEGRAEAASTSNRLPYLVPNLIEAMFTNFPGHNGETVRITVAPERNRSAPAN